MIALFTALYVLPAATEMSATALQSLKVLPYIFVRLPPKAIFAIWSQFSNAFSPRFLIFGSESAVSLSHFENAPSSMISTFGASIATMLRQPLKAFLPIFLTLFSFTLVMFVLLLSSEGFSQLSGSSSAGSKKQFSAISVTLAGISIAPLAPSHDFSTVPSITWAFAMQQNCIRANASK